MVSKYKERSGFVIESPIKSFQFKGSVKKLLEYIQKTSAVHTATLQSLNSGNVKKVAELHNRVGGNYGIEFWKGWMQLRTVKSIVAIDSSENIVGFISGAPVNENRLRM